MYKGIAGSEGIGIGKVVLIEEHDLTVEKKSVTDTDAELKRLQDAIEKFVSIRNSIISTGCCLLCIKISK